MTHIRNPGAEHRTFVRSSRAVGAVMMAAMVGLSTLIPALADPPKLRGLFAHKYNPFYIDTVTKANLALMLHVPSFQTLVETRGNGLPGKTRPDILGGIH
jgi:hypothetical protein